MKSYKKNLFVVADIQCGGLSRKGKVVGGNDAEPGEYPWLASVTRRGGHFCGGSLLSRNFVLTAGHCMCRSATIYHFISSTS